MTEKIDFATAEVLPNLPDCFHPENGKPIPAGLIGARVVRFGALADQARVEGGLVIDYRPSGSDLIRRVVLGFTELGMWTEWEGPSGDSPNPGEPQ